MRLGKEEVTDAIHLLRVMWRGLLQQRHELSLLRQARPPGASAPSDPARPGARGLLARQRTGRGRGARGALRPAFAGSPAAIRRELRVERRELRVNVR